MARRGVRCNPIEARAIDSASAYISGMTDEPLDGERNELRFAYIAVLRAMFAEWRKPVSWRRQFRLNRLERKLDHIDAALKRNREL